MGDIKKPAAPRVHRAVTAALVAVLSLGAVPAFAADGTPPSGTETEARASSPKTRADAALRAGRAIAAEGEDIRYRLELQVPEGSDGERRDAKVALCGTDGKARGIDIDASSIEIEVNGDKFDGFKVARTETGADISLKGLPSASAVTIGFSGRAGAGDAAGATVTARTSFDGFTGELEVSQVVALVDADEGYATGSVSLAEGDDGGAGTATWSALALIPEDAADAIATLSGLPDWFGPDEANLTLTVDGKKREPEGSGYAGGELTLRLGDVDAGSRVDIEVSCEARGGLSPDAAVFNVTDDGGDLLACELNGDAPLSIDSVGIEDGKLSAAFTANEDADDGVWAAVALPEGAAPTGDAIVKVDGEAVSADTREEGRYIEFCLLDIEKGSKVEFRVPMKERGSEGALCAAAAVGDEDEAHASGVLSRATANEGVSDPDDAGSASAGTDEAKDTAAVSGEETAGKDKGDSVPDSGQGSAQEASAELGKLRVDVSGVESAEEPGGIATLSQAPMAYEAEPGSEPVAKQVPADTLSRASALPQGGISTMAARDNSGDLFSVKMTSSPSTVSPGGKLTQTVTIDANRAASNVTVKITPDKDFSFDRKAPKLTVTGRVSSKPSIKVADDGTIVATIPDLPEGGQIKIAISGTVTGSAQGGSTIASSVEARADGMDSPQRTGATAKVGGASTSSNSAGSPKSSGSAGGKLGKTGDENAGILASLAVAAGALALGIRRNLKMEG